MDSQTSKQHPAAGPPAPEETFESIIAPIQREREGLMLQIAAEEIRGMRVLASRVQARFDAVGVDPVLRTDSIFASDALEVLAGQTNREIESRS